MLHQGNPGAQAPDSKRNVRRTYSVAEVAEMYGVHASTIYREIDAGHLKAMRIGAKGGVVRVPVWAIDEYESASTYTGGEQAQMAVAS